MLKVVDTAKDGLSSLTTGVKSVLPSLEEREAEVKLSDHKEQDQSEKLKLLKQKMQNVENGIKVAAGELLKNPQGERI